MKKVYFLTQLETSDRSLVVLADEVRAVPASHLPYSTGQHWVFRERTP